VPSSVGLFISGYSLGKLSSFGIGTKPPMLSTRSIILASMAPVVATVVSLLDHAILEASVSVLSCLKNKSSVRFAE